MKVRVVKRYVDRYSLKMMEAGAEHDYEPERAKKLEKAGYVKIIAKKEKE